jgi:hypothetical protein
MDRAFCLWCTASSPTQFIRQYHFHYSNLLFHFVTFVSSSKILYVKVNQKIESNFAILFWQNNFTVVDLSVGCHLEPKDGDSMFLLYVGVH